MFTKIASQGSVGRVQKTLVVLLALVVLFVSVPLDQAFAFSYTPVSGTIGNVSVPTIYVGDLTTSCAIIYDYRVCPPVFTLYAETGPIAYRSPGSSGSQIVYAKYLVDQWDGSKWVTIAVSDLLRGQIGANQTSLRFAAPYMPLQVARGYFRFTWAFDWYTKDGALLGSTYIHSNLASDHVCVTPIRLCQSYNGYVRTGGYQTGGW